MLPAMKKPSRHTLILVGSLASLALSLYFGLTATTTLYMLGGFTSRHWTDWGRVALTPVFGFAGCVGLMSLLRKP